MVHREVLDIKLPKHGTYKIRDFRCQFHFDLGDFWAPAHVFVDFVGPIRGKGGEQEKAVEDPVHILQAMVTSQLKQC
jgi:hypothetical protein